VSQKSEITHAEWDFNQSAGKAREMLNEIVQTIRQRQAKGQNADSAWRYFHAIKNLIRAAEGYLAEKNDLIAQQKQWIIHQNTTITTLQNINIYNHSKAPKPAHHTERFYDKNRARAGSIIYSQQNDNW